MAQEMSPEEWKGHRRKNAAKTDQAPDKSKAGLNDRKADGTKADKD